MDAGELTEDQRQLVLDISSDFYRYAENNLWIKDKDSNIVKFVPNVAQKAVIDRVIELLTLGEPVRMIILKARQMGLSTAIEALIYWWTSTHKNITSVIVGHEDQSAKNLYNMFKRYYEHCNPIFQPTRKYNTRGDLVFDVSDEVKEKFRQQGLVPPGLGSTIKTSTAKNTSTGRSDTVQIIHGSEIGEWENGEDLVASLLQTVPRRPNTMIFLESTANGRGNFFYKQWTASVKGDTPFEPFFFPWWLHEEYEIEGEIDNYTQEEKDIVEIIKDGITIAGKDYHVDESRIPAKINYRRYKEREFKATPEKLYQEYPSTAHEAFIATGRPVFDLKMLSHMEKQCPLHTYKHYELVEGEDREIKAVETDEYGLLKVWDLPERGKDYVIGGDPAEGLKYGDFSVADVIRVEDMKTVAKLRGHIDPDHFGHWLDKLGRFYNYALIGCEINNHGLAVVQRLRDLFYTNLYRREKGIDERFEEPTARLGWKTDIRTKPLAIDYLAEAIRDGYIKDYDIVFVEEGFSYIKDDNGRTNAEEGNFDDTIMAKAIALQMFEWSNNNKADLMAYKPEKMTTRKKAHKVIK